MITFIHIPKTGGTSIQSTMDSRSHGHLKLSQIKGKQFFSCCRNPYDRACSIYYFLKSMTRPNKPAEKIKDRARFPVVVAARSKNLVEFWREVHKHGAPERARLVHKQADFLRDKPGEGGISPRIKHLLRYETLQDDWLAFAKQYGFAELPHLNKSERPAPWQDEMTPELINIINERFADDFEHLGYERL